MSSTSIERGDIVLIKPEWLEVGENGEQKYVVLQDYGNNRVLIRAFDTGLPLPPVNTVDINSLLYCGRSYPKYEPEQIPSGMNVYIEASFTIKSTGEHKTIEVKINEELIPFGVAKCLTRRYGEISGLCFHFTREANNYCQVNNSEKSL